MLLDILKRLFAAFLRSHAFTRHFRRLALLETVTRTGVSRDFPPELAAELVAAARSDAAALLERLGSHPDGISESLVRSGNFRSPPEDHSFRGRKHPSKN